MNYKLEIKSNGVAILSLNRPELHNAFNDDLIKELIDQFNYLDRSENVRLLVLTGVGKSFCAGADLNWMKRMKDYSFAENVEDANRLCDLFTVLNNFSKPVIGKINGSALGGGAGLVACVDFAIAVDSALFGFTEARLGLIPAVISPFVIAKINESHARAYFLSGERFSAIRAYEIGLIHKVSSAENFEADFENVVNEFLMAAPNASRISKELIKRVKNESSISHCRKLTCEMIAERRQSAEGQEGMDALLNKRKAKWL